MKAVFFDIDGTLIPTGLRGLSPSVEAALNELKGKGIRIIVCTGRHRNELEMLGIPQNLFDAFITMNGQYCYDKEGCFFSHCIEGGDADKLIAMFDRNEHAMLLATRDKIFSNRPLPEEEKEGRNYITVVNSFPGGHIMMATVFCPPEADKEINTAFEGLKTARWHEAGTDIIPAAFGKHSGILSYLNKEKINLWEAMAFGDGQNDMDMLKLCGIGVAMGDCPEEVRQIADYVTDTCENDGIRKALEHFGLIR